MLVLAYYDGMNVKGTLHISKWLDRSWELLKKYQKNVSLQIAQEML